jgi:hypothetical protein
MSKRTSEGGNNAEVVRVWLLGGFRVSVGSRTIGEDHWQCRKAAARHSRDPAAYWAAIDLYAGELLPEDSYEEAYVGLMRLHALRRRQGDALRQYEHRRVTSKDAGHECLRAYSMVG